MSKKNTKAKSRSRRKRQEFRGRVNGVTTSGVDDPAIQLSLPIAEILAGVSDAVERTVGEAGLLIMKALIDEEVEQLAGGRYERSESRQGRRWGREEGYLVFGGKKVPFARPRVRKNEGGELPLERYRSFQSDGRLQQAAARQVVLGVSMRDYEKAVDGMCDGYGIQRSSVSRHWKAISTKQLEAFVERPLGDLDLLAIVIDGVHFQDHVLAVALGVAADGKKHVLGMWPGATENAQLCKGLLGDLARRGLSEERRYLLVLDGSKALHKAVRKVFGANAVIQRCQVHKQSNVLSYLPKRCHFQVKMRLRMAWGMTDYREAKKELEKIADDLDDVSLSAAASLREALEETLTLHRLGVPPALRRSLRSTNLIENCFSTTRKYCRNVKNWQNENMVMRWGGSMLLEAERRFRRVKGYRSLPSLSAALNATVEAEVMHA